jgi:hypothetical protein
MVHPVGRARKLQASPTPDWGLHLADFNLPLQQLVDDVGIQSRAWLKARKPAR